MSEIKCPFCQQELERNDLDVQMFGCENQNCKHSIHYDTAGTKKLWQELIRTRKALETAVDGLEKMTWGCDSSDAEHLLKEIKKITALEQKDVK